MSSISLASPNSRDSGRGAGRNPVLRLKLFRSEQTGCMKERLKRSKIVLLEDSLVTDH